MHFFTIINGAFGLIHAGGVYQQVQLYARGEAVYAQRGGGFIKLGIGGATSAPKVRWSEIDAGETATIVDRDGRAPAYQGETESAPVLEAAE